MSAPSNPGGVPYIVDDIVPLTVADASDGLALSTEAGWNQIAADWLWLLAAGMGFGIRNTAGSIIATSLALPYPPDFGWVSLVLVHEPYRRRGLASRLLGRAADALVAAGLTPMLDATPAGRAVYTALGFSDVEPINRWRGAGGAIVESTPEAADLAGIAGPDALAFGADRMPLLQAIAGRPENRVVLHDGGYALIRHGRTAAQIGPIVASTPAVAVRLLHLAVQQTAGPIVLDVAQRCAQLSAALDDFGFVIERGLTRMARGAPRNFGNPALVAAIAGPELG